MKLHMQSIHFDADIKLLNFIQKKLDKLETFYDHIISGEVFLRLNKDTENRENKLVEIKINIPGKDLFVKESSNTFEAAVDVAVEALKAQLKKHKEKAAEARVAASI